jgi:hypothetical protein
LSHAYMKGYDDSSLLYKRACTGFQKVLGLDHPHTHSCLKQYESMLAVLAGTSILAGTSSRAGTSVPEWRSNP